MTMKKLRLIYMGTPEFAVAGLKALIEADYNVVAVVTMPDKPSGRGHRIHYSAVKEYALERQLPLLQPERLKDEHFLEALRAFHADLQVVVAFRMLPEVVWAMPPLGTINLHASLLPHYRGAAPINWALINGETVTGVTTFFLQQIIDTGNLILQQAVPITPNDTFGSLHDKLMNVGVEILLETIDRITTGVVQTLPQEELTELKTAPKITKETCRIFFNRPAEEVRNLVRGLSPYPAAWFELTEDNKMPTGIKVFEVATEITPHNLPFGTLITDGKRMLKVAVSDGFVHIISLQLAGKKRMQADEFLRGYGTWIKQLAVSD
ncbi:MAG: methionyl-tRNA formyltransferase [Prevotellaceae bacterium]|jgi:methionyl-tRNA formyltransferase|nr:methionyl-tRNA formyltransferase [Prevotellaceae bacterium]